MGKGDKIKGLWVARQLRERELILEVLRTETDPLDALAVRYALDTLGTPVLEDHFARHLDYLEEKGYLRQEVKRLGRVKTVLIEITAKGRDLLSGLIDDIGVGGSANGTGENSD